MLEKHLKRIKRHRRIRAKIKGTSKVPRLCVFRSAKHIYVQAIDDEKGRVLFQASDNEVNLKNKSNDKTEKKENKSRKVELSYLVGKLIAEKCLNQKIKKIIFDRGGYKYHGRVKALAEGAREGGLEF